MPRCKIRIRCCCLLNGHIYIRCCGCARSCGGPCCACATVRHNKSHMWPQSLSFGSRHPADCFSLHRLQIPPQRYLNRDHVHICCCCCYCRRYPRARAIYLQLRLPWFSCVGTLSSDIRSGNKSNHVLDHVQALVGPLRSLNCPIFLLSGWCMKPRYGPVSASLRKQPQLKYRYVRMIACVKR